MTQPPSTASASYYKIATNAYVTFGWNLTSLYATPTSLTIIASCSQNGNTYPIGPATSGGNTIPATQTQIVWSPWEYEQVAGAVPLAAATYVLKVWDERGPTAAVSPGRFSPYSGTNFALYRPQPYTPLPQWVCTSCKSSALALVSRPGPLMMLVTLLVMVMSGWGLVGRRRRD